MARPVRKLRALRRLGCGDPRTDRTSANVIALHQPSWWTLRMQLREALAILAGVAVARPLAVRAQQKKVSVVGFLDSGTPNPSGVMSGMFGQGLRETGYVEGQNLAIEWRG